MTAPRPSLPVDVRPADHWDLHVMARTIAYAFHDLAVCEWLVPDRVDRMAVLYQHFLIHADHGLRHGEAFVADPDVGVAVWHDYTTQPLPHDIEDYDERLQWSTRRFVDRFRALDALFDKHHPAAPHYYLAFLAVSPTQQGHGVGTALLRHRLRDLDRAGMPGYLVASSEESRRLYLKHAFLDHGEQPIQLPDGPRMWPMWRLPQPPITP